MLENKNTQYLRSCPQNNNKRLYKSNLDHHKKAQQLNSTLILFLILKDISHASKSLFYDKA